MGEGNAQVQGHSPEPGASSVRWRNIAATQRPDGTWALQVDTELVLDGASVTISNIKVASVDQTSGTLRYLKALDDGTVVVTVVSTDPLDGLKAARSQDAGAFPHYFGLVNDVEDWVIIRESRTANVSTFEYVSGAGNFVTNWDNRATPLAYQEFFDEF